jgi:hypothetical protein
MNAPTCLRCAPAISGFTLGRLRSVAPTPERERAPSWGRRTTQGKARRTSYRYLGRRRSRRLRPRMSLPGLTSCHHGSAGYASPPRRKSRMCRLWRQIRQACRQARCRRRPVGPRPRLPCATPSVLRTLPITRAFQARHRAGVKRDSCQRQGRHRQAAQKCRKCAPLFASRIGNMRVPWSTVGAGYGACVERSVQPQEAERHLVRALPMMTMRIATRQGGRDVVDGYASAAA